ncbi:transcription regulator protein [Liberibacter crescens BT-1]|uniref:Transcription regulator protein n=1 Tax=Liberibacter crescens (strain BT-1) TaxID=1215343 RepID=L0ERD6_LIBCB|nr:MucR family transcriptional regulator [Liberibacter crescens]AGA64029.1 transcription regulator protein [Liberibacter crescens BT-1]AMC12336.1 transcriptional regulator [Liberibacter crescens]
MVNNNSIDASEKLLELTVGIVAAYVGNHVVPMTEIGCLIADVHSILKNTVSQTLNQITSDIEKSKPAVPIRKSIEDGFLVCLEDGMKFKSLKRHLMTYHNMTPEEYRLKWGLPSDYPMVSKDYANARSKLAKDMGLGKNRKKNQVS